MRKDGSTLIRRLTVGSLFSGIGGIDLGLERAGMHIKWMVENDPFCRLVLRHHWPHITLHENVKRKIRLEPVDVVAGGFPCQSVSLAGKRLHTEDARWLWPQMLSVIRQVEPRWVLVENVEGLRTKGLCEVLEGLAECGYDAEWDRIPASWVGAPHQRRRYFVVGYPEGSGLEEGACIFSEPLCVRDAADSGLSAANTPSIGLDGNESLESEGRAKKERGEKIGHFGDGASPRHRIAANSNGQRREEQDGSSVTGRKKRAGIGDEAGTLANTSRSVSASSGRRANAGSKREAESSTQERERLWADSGAGDGSFANTSGERRQQDVRGTPGDEEANGWRPQDDHLATGLGEGGLQTDWGQYRASVERWQEIIGRPSPQPLIRRVDDGVPVGLGSISDRLRALGNSVVPQVSEWVGWKIVKADKMMFCEGGKR